MAPLVSHGYGLQFRKKLIQMDCCIHMEQGTEFKLWAQYTCMPAVPKVLSLDPHRIFLNFSFWLISISILVFCWENLFFYFIFQQEGKSSLNTAKYNKHLQMGWSAAGGFNFVVFIWNIKASRARLKHSGHNSQCFGSWANSSWT